MRRPLTALLTAASVAVASLALAGCNDHPLVGSPTITGTYSLQTINGKRPPYVVTDPPREILSDTIFLYQGATYAKSEHVRITANGQTTTATEHETGTYSLMGNSVFLTTSDGRTLKVAVLTPPNMTFVRDGVTSVYRK